MFVAQIQLSVIYVRSLSSAALVICKLVVVKRKIKTFTGDDRWRRELKSSSSKENLSIVTMYIFFKHRILFEPHKYCASKLQTHEMMDWGSSFRDYIFFFSFSHQCQEIKTFLVLLYTLSCLCACLVHIKLF